MADGQDTHFSVPCLNRWFAVTSLLLLISCVWMILDDFHKPWKVYQREFRDIELDRARRRLAQEDAAAMLAEEERLRLELERTRDGMQGRRGELDAAETRLRELESEQFTATEAEKQAKELFHWERFLAEEQRAREDDPGHGAARVASFEKEWQERLGDKERADSAVEEQRAVVAGLNAGLDEVQAQLKAATRQIEIARRTLARLDPEDTPARIANLIRDRIPGTDFIDPGLEIRKVVLEDLPIELDFARKKRVDMCMSCHVPIDRKGFDGEELAHPHRSHPRLDLFLSADSPHPIDEIGCTICHRGSGEALDFQRADHRPTDAAQAQRWRAEHGWHKEHHWDDPMLPSGLVEASCVQCHKDSMDLIAEHAPQVSEGYRLVERYGCYACHRIDWFPTERRPGPALKGIRRKMDRESIASWITDPKSFRPTTWMPRVFHLENYAAEDVVLVSDYGAGEPVRGKEWNESAVAAITAFLWSRAEETELPPIPVAGAAERGGEQFRLIGCLGCHNLAPHQEEARAELDRDFYADPALKRRGTNEYGPNLRGIATKLKPEWMYRWLRDPGAHWAETRMPDLRLSEQEAADIVAYVTDDPTGVFHDTPEGWQPQEGSHDPSALREQARWLYLRSGREEIDRRLREEWSDEQVMLEAVGERLVSHQGCHSCHEIAGLEEAKRIGTELSNWGSKTVDRLAWGTLPELLAHERGLEGLAHRQFAEEFQAYRESFLLQKLDQPRSFDRQMIKSPSEKLRMPWFRFTDEEARAIATFVLGLVDDEVELARMVPSGSELVVDEGRRVLRQKNCAACHVIEPGSVDFEDEHGLRHSVRGQITPLEDELLPPPMEDFQRYLADYVEWMREDEADYELEGVQVQLLRPEPGLGDVGDVLFIEKPESISTAPPWGGDILELTTSYYLSPWDWDEASGSLVSATADPEAQGRVQDVDGLWRAYEEEPYEKIRWAFAPPFLIDAGVKLQSEWLYRYFLDPVPVREQIRVRMPTFRWAESEAGAVADYFTHVAQRRWPMSTARRMLVERGKDAAQAAAEMRELGLEGAPEARIRGILDGHPLDTAAGLDALLAYARAIGYFAAPPVDPNHETVLLRQPSVLGPLLEARPSLLEDAYRLMVEGPNCLECHFVDGTPPTTEAPLSWAPDLALVRERLRPDWCRELLIDPIRIYPGTSMPANFAADEDAWQELFPATSAEQIEAVLLLLFNLDRARIEGRRD